MLAAIFVLCLGGTQTVIAADKIDMATSALEFGGSVGHLLWVAVKDETAVTQADAKRYEKLAYQVKEQIDMGRASSGLIKSNFNLIGTTLAYGAVVDPEPISNLTESHSIT
jgi:hypothetical protein